MFCEFCSKECKNNNSLRNHQRLCRFNPERQISSFVRYNKEREGPWNKGLNKDIDNRVKNNGKSISKTMVKKIKDGGVLPINEWVKTPEGRKKLSECKKKLYKEFPEKHPNRKLANNRIKISYPERVAYDWFQNSGVSFEHQSKILNFYVDFKVGDVIIEIDGYRWHDPVKDAKRDQKLKALGFTVHRIDTRERIERRLQEIFG